MLDQRLRRWANIKPALVQRLLLAGEHVRTQVLTPRGTGIINYSLDPNKIPDIVRMRTMRLRSHCRNFGQFWQQRDARVYSTTLIGPGGTLTTKDFGKFFSNKENGCTYIPGMRNLSII